MSSLHLRSATPEDHTDFQRLFEELGVDDPPATLETFVHSFVRTMFFAEENGEALVTATSGCSKAPRIWVKSQRRRARVDVASVAL